MLMIISSRFDQSTSMVIEWLIQKKVSFKRCNGEDDCISATIQIEENGALNIEMENLAVVGGSSIYFSDI